MKESKGSQMLELLIAFLVLGNILAVLLAVLNDIGVINTLAPAFVVLGVVLVLAVFVIIFLSIIIAVKDRYPDEDNPSEVKK